MKPHIRASVVAFMAAIYLYPATSSAESYLPGSEDDPHIRASRFLGSDQRYLSAVSELLELQRISGDQFEAGADYWAALAEFYLSFGMRDRAESIYRTVAASVADPLEAGKARLRMAEFEYQRGYVDEARASLLRAREKLPRELDYRWKDVYSRVLMAQGRYNEAVAVLEDITGAEDDTAYLRFNLGIALINDGQVAPGRTALDRVGRQQGESEPIRALRDKANVTLGWHFLQNQLGGSAQPVLSRVRSIGPYANRALLGMGWAQIAPEGNRQLRSEINAQGSPTGVNDPFSGISALGVLLRHGYLDDPYERAGIRSFRRTKGTKNEDEALRGAIAIWSELIDRDPQDPAVHEAWLAIPFALDQLGAHAEALQYYEQAVARLDAARKRSADAIASIKGGRMVETLANADPEAEGGWMWELRDLPDAPETYYLQTVIADHPYSETLKNYRDLRAMARGLDQWKERVPALNAARAKALRDNTIEPAVLFAQAKLNRVETDENVSLPLREAATLAAPDFGTNRPNFPLLNGLPLKLSELPEKFVGPFDSIGSLQKRLEALRPLLDAAARDNAIRLRSIALEELRAQKKQIEKYLVEARFALARIYDGAIPEQDQDEFEVRRDGSEVREPKLERGEVEIDKSKPLAEQMTQPAPASPTRRSRKQPLGPVEGEYEIK